MAKSDAHKAEAPGQAAGYIFQLRYALYRGLERLRRDPTASIGIEKIDDVMTLDGGGSATVEQLKHSTQLDHVASDFDKALWRTLGNWIDLIASGKVQLTRVDFVLVMTSDVLPGSALAQLTVDDDSRDPASALAAIREIANKSKSKATATDRAKFLELANSEQHALLKSIRVVANSPAVGAITTELDAALKFTCEAAQVPELRQELEGWWVQQISEQLETGSGAVVPVTQLDAKISYLREKYKASNLQFDDEEPGEVALDLDGYMFVDQIRAVGAGSARIANAQKVFMKARAQRSKWLRAAKVDPNELSRYDADLIERWQARAAACWDGIGESSTEAERIDAGRTLLSWAETSETPLRGATAVFLTSGSFHSLADLVHVGWHPDYGTKFKPK